MQLINTHYFYKNKNMKSDKLIYILKDEDGNKSFKVMEKPILKYYVTKPQYWNDPEYDYIEKHKVDEITCYYKDIYKSISNSLNDEYMSNHYNQCFELGGNINSCLRKMHLDYRLHDSDINIQDSYMIRYIEKYPVKDFNYKLTKCVFDIEVDTAGIDGFPEPEVAAGPVNIISMVDINNKKIYAFCLKYDNESYKEAMGNMKNILLELREKYKKELDGDIFSFSVNEFDEEIDLIKSFYDVINYEIKPDFVMGWHSHNFDNIYLINRIKRLKYEPTEIMCPEEFPYKAVKYRKDRVNPKATDNSSEVIITGYTVWLDSENLYANLRKGAGQKESYALNYIAEEEVGFKKNEQEDFATFHLNDYTKFFQYSIQDSVLLYMLEEKNKDADLLYRISMMTGTRIEKALKKTIILRNLASIFYQDKDYVISNNKSSLKEKPEGKIRGAFVADPVLMKKTGLSILEEFSKFIFEACIDLDLVSLYPSIDLAFNISPKSSYGTAHIFNEEGERVTDLFIDDYTSGNVISFCKNWLNLPDLDYYIEKLEKLGEGRPC